MVELASLLRRKPIRWASIGRKVLQQEAKRKEREFREHKVCRFYEKMAAMETSETNASGRKRLESMEAAFRYFFEHSGVKLGYMQDQLIRTVKIAFLKNMFTNDLVSNLLYLCEKFLIQELFDTVAVTVPRRVCYSLSLSSSNLE